MFKHTRPTTTEALAHRRVHHWPHVTPSATNRHLARVGKQSNLDEEFATLIPTIRILMIDKHEIVREGLRTLLAEEHEMAVIGEATHSSEALGLVARLKPDVILIDLMLAEKDGIETIRHIHQLHPSGQIVVLTSFCEERMVRAAIQAGATGYLLKDLLKADLISAIQAAARGEPTLHPAAQRVLMRQSSNHAFQALTERELDVLRLLAQGRSNRQIGDALCLTEGTVKGYVSTILAKLQVEDRTQAALYAVKHGLVPLNT